MPRIRFLPLLVLPSLFVWCSGCGGTFPNQAGLQTNPTTLPLAEREYEIVDRGLKAQVCQLKVLGLGIGDSSYLRAFDELRAQVPEELGQDYQFVNVAVDESFSFYLLAYRVCTIVSADLVSLGKYASSGGQSLQETPQGEMPIDADPYEEPEPGFSDITESRKTYKARCDNDKPAACEKLARMWQHGIDGPRRVTKAVLIHKKACELGAAASCAYMGKVLGVRDPEASARYYKKACELGATEHCKNP